MVFFFGYTTFFFISKKYYVLFLLLKNGYLNLFIYVIKVKNQFLFYEKEFPKVNIIQWSNQFKINVAS